VTAPVSACVIAREDEATLGRCLDSLAWADERIVVVDDRSGDATESIARKAGARVFRHRYDGNVEQKNIALDQAVHDWVLALDADEALSPGLVGPLQDFLARDDPEIEGVELNRLTFHLGRWIRHGDFHPDWQLRLFRRSRGRWEGRNPHGRVRVAGAVLRVPGDLEHYSYADLSDQVERIRAFSRIEARRLYDAGRRTRLVDLALRPPARFARAYLLKAGFRDGVPGLVIAAATAFHVFLKYALLWELERGAGRR
jgi:glycosyltransferase involved in cell wall biosynthesis